MVHGASVGKSLRIACQNLKQVVNRLEFVTSSQYSEWTCLHITQDRVTWLATSNR